MRRPLQLHTGRRKLNYTIFAYQASIDIIINPKEEYRRSLTIRDSDIWWMSQPHQTRAQPLSDGIHG